MWREADICARQPVRDIGEKITLELAIEFLDDCIAVGKDRRSRCHGREIMTFSRRMSRGRLSLVSKRSKVSRMPTPPLAQNNSTALLAASAPLA